MVSPAFAATEVGLKVRPLAPTAIGNVSARTAIEAARRAIAARMSILERGELVEGQGGIACHRSADEYLYTILPGSCADSSTCASGHAGRGTNLIALTLIALALRTHAQPLHISLGLSTSPAFM